MRRKLKEVHDQLKLTLVYVTHDQVEALTFADKVMVMYEGEIVQVGTPQELFENPKHKFVGYFIGSPGMNYIPCELDGNMARFDGVGVELDGETATLGKKAGGKLELGIRPMYLEVSPVAVDGAIKADVRGVDDQGSYKIVTISMAGHILRARLPEERPAPGNEAWVRFPKDWTRLYSNERLVTGGPE